MLCSILRMFSNPFMQVYMMTTRDLAKFMIVPVGHLVEAEAHIRVSSFTTSLFTLLMLFDAAKGISERCKSTIIFFSRLVVFAELGNVLAELN